MSVWYLYLVIAKVGIFCCPTVIHLVNVINVLVLVILLIFNCKFAMFRSRKVAFVLVLH